MLAIIVIGFHIVVGGIATALVLMFGGPYGDLTVLALKGVALVSYFAGIALGGLAWSRRHWALIGLPVTSVGMPFMIVLVGNKLVRWGLPIGH